MKELIGVEHYSKKGADAVFDYVLEKFSKVNSVMLELPEKNNVSFNYFNYFEYLAEKFSNQGIKVIRGDRFRKEAGLASIGYLFGFVSETKAINIIRHKRNEDFNYLFEELNPEITILGAAHTSYIKLKNPAIPHSFFSEGFIFNFDKKEKEKVLSSIDSLFTVGFTLLSKEKVIEKYTSLNEINRID